MSLTGLCGLAAGILPALRSTRVAPTEAIKAQSRQVGHAGGRRGAAVGKMLVAAQMAFCLLLLIVAGLFVRSMQVLSHTDVGFDRDRLLVARMDVRSMGYSERTAPGALRSCARAAAPHPRRRRRSSASLNGPLGTSWRASSLIVEGYTPAPDEQLVTNEEIVTADYFATVGLALVEGRGFTADDNRPGSRSTIINQSMARRFFPSGGAVGKRWTSGRCDPGRLTGDRRGRAGCEIRRRPRRDAEHGLPACPGRRPWTCSAIWRFARPAIRRRSRTTVRQALAELEPALPVFDVVPLDQRVNRGLTNDRLIANLTSAFGIVALLLACLGLYGTISYGVSCRISELGVRMALGADRATVAWLVVREAITLVGVGAALGVPLAFVAGRSVLSLLHGVDAVDLASYSQAIGAAADRRGRRRVSAGSSRVADRSDDGASRGVAADETRIQRIWPQLSADEHRYWDSAQMRDNVHSRCVGAASGHAPASAAIGRGLSAPHSVEVSRSLNVVDDHPVNPRLQSDHMKGPSPDRGAGDNANVQNARSRP